MDIFCHCKQTLTLRFVFLERKGKMGKYGNEMWEGDSKKWEEMENEMFLCVFGGG